MFIWIVLVLATSVKDQCVAPTTMPDPLPSEFKLKHVQIVTRHGARTPIKIYSKIPANRRGIWRCDSNNAVAGRIEAVPMELPRRVRHIIDPRLSEYPDNCHTGDLTTDGMKEHESLGKSFRSYLIDKSKFIDEYLNPNDIYVRATYYDRTYRSALSFMKGLYPPASPNEMYQIITGTKSYDVLRPKTSFCPEIQELYNNFTTSQSFNQTWDSFTKLKPVAQFMGVSTSDISETSLLCDLITTMTCNEQTFPFEEEIKKQFIEANDDCTRMDKLLINDMYNLDDATRGISFSYGMREVFRILDNSLSQFGQKFILLSAHDNTVAAYLGLLNVTNSFTSAPPYASYLLFEVYSKGDEMYIRYVYNGNVLKIPYMTQSKDLPEGVYVLHDFRTIVEPMIDHCHNLDY